MPQTIRQIHETIIRPKCLTAGKRWPVSPTHVSRPEEGREINKDIWYFFKICLVAYSYIGELCVLLWNRIALKTNLRLLHAAHSSVNQALSRKQQCIACIKTQYIKRHTPLVVTLEGWQDRQRQWHGWGCHHKLMQCGMMTDKHKLTLTNSPWVFP